jgi:hypothetical protein
LAAVLLSNSTL